MKKHVCSRMISAYLVAEISLPRRPQAVIPNKLSPDLFPPIELSEDQEFPQTAGMRSGNFSLAALSAGLGKAAQLRMIEPAAMTYREALDA